MKKALLAGIAAATILTSFSSCVSKQTYEDARSENDSLSVRLNETVATQDSLLALVAEINGGMAQIKELEQIFTTPDLSESPSRKQQLLDDMAAIRQTLQQRREKLDEYERQLKSSKSKNANLLKTVETLRAQIAEQETEITTLTNRLAEANIQIGELNQRVDSIAAVAATEAEGRAQAEEDAVQLNNELNTCWYAIGTKSELKKQGIIESGFLKSTKVLKGDFNSNYFTRADQRNLSEIPLHSKKAEVLTTQPKDSYEIVDVNGQKVLRILDPTKFWRLTNMLVIKVD